MGKLKIAVAWLCLIHTAGQAQVPDDVAKKISAAKNTYYAERDKAEKVLLDAMLRRESTAKKSGDLKALQIARMELEAFRKEARLPKLVPSALFQTSMNGAYKKAESVFLTAIKKSTQQDNVEEAKALQKLLDEFYQAAKYTLDLLQPKTVWADELGVRKMTILERQAESFRAHEIMTTTTEQRIREFKGSIKDGQITILEKDVKFIAGTKYYKDTKGLLSIDERGEKIDFSYTNNDGKVSNFVLRPQP